MRAEEDVEDAAGYGGEEEEREKEESSPAAAAAEATTAAAALLRWRSVDRPGGSIKLRRFVRGEWRRRWCAVRAAVLGGWVVRCHGVSQIQQREEREVSILRNQECQRIRACCEQKTKTKKAWPSDGCE